MNTKMVFTGEFPAMNTKTILTEEISCPEHKINLQRSSLP